MTLLNDESTSGNFSHILTDYILMNDFLFAKGACVQLLQCHSVFFPHYSNEKYIITIIQDDVILETVVFSRQIAGEIVIKVSSSVETTLHAEWENKKWKPHKKTTLCLAMNMIRDPVRDASGRKPSRKKKE